MNHFQARDQFTRYHDGDLSDKEHRDVEDHIKNCKDCHQEWEAFKLTVTEISGLLQLEPPSNFALNVEQKIKKRSKGRFFGNENSFSTHFAVISFILILLFILAYLVLTATSEVTILKNDEEKIISQ